MSSWASINSFKAKLSLDKSILAPTLPSFPCKKKRKMIIIDQIKQTKNQQPYNFYLFPFESSIVLCCFFEIHEKVFFVLVALAFATYLRTISNIVICSDQAFITVFQGVISKSYFLFPFSLTMPFEYRFSYYKFTLYHASKYSHCMFMVKVCQDLVILLI